jgi:hypothetical protein
VLRNCRRKRQGRSRASFVYTSFQYFYRQPARVPCSTIPGQQYLTCCLVACKALYPLGPTAMLLLMYLPQPLVSKATWIKSQVGCNKVSVDSMYKSQKEWCSILVRLTHSLPLEGGIVEHVSTLKCPGGRVSFLTKLLVSMQSKQYSSAITCNTANIFQSFH